VRGHRRTRSAARLDEANGKVDGAPHSERLIHWHPCSSSLFLSVLSPITFSVCPSDMPFTCLDNLAVTRKFSRRRLSLCAFDFVVSSRVLGDVHRDSCTSCYMTKTTLQSCTIVS
jgi:hypothetical protein